MTDDCYCLGSAVPKKRLDGPAVARVASGRRECGEGSELTRSLHLHSNSLRMTDYCYCLGSAVP